MLRFLEKLPKLYSVTFNKSFRKGVRSQEREADGEEDYSAESSPIRGARGGRIAAHADEKEKKKVTLREQEKEKMRVVRQSLRNCSPASIAVPFCRFNAADLDAFLG